MDGATTEVIDEKTNEPKPKKFVKEWTNIVKLIDMAFKGEGGGQVSLTHAHEIKAERLGRRGQVKH